VHLARILAIGCLVAASRAGADNASFHATATGDVAVTDNAGATPDNKQADIFVQIRPGILYAYDSPRMIHELTAEVEALEYIINSQGLTLNERAAYHGYYLPGPRSNVLVSADGQTGQLNALASGTSADQTGVAAQSGGRVDIRQADLGEYATYLAGKETHTSESINGTWVSTDDNAALTTTTDSYIANATLAIDHAFDHDTLALEAGGTYLRLERVSALPPGPQGSRLDTELDPRATLTWRHDLSKLWSASATGGVIYVKPVGDDPYNPGEVRHGGAFPIANVLVSYTDVWGRASLQAGRAVTPNLFIAENTQTDSVIAQLSLPLRWFEPNGRLDAPHWVALATLGYDRSQLYDPPTGSLLGELQVARADVAVGWTPHPGQTYALRYELFYQHADNVASSILVNPSFVRNTLFFTFSLRYPERIAVTIPKRTQAFRSDRSDLVEPGAEPVVPDSAEGGGDDSSGDP
jgi:hypothetical protein